MRYKCPADSFNEQHTYSLFHIVSHSAWVAQLVELPTLAQFMILWFVNSSPALGSVPTSWSLLEIVSPSLSAPALLTLTLSQINMDKNKKKHKYSFIYEEQEKKVIAKCDNSRM